MFNVKEDKCHLIFNVDVMKIMYYTLLDESSLKVLRNILTPRVMGIFWLPLIEILAKRYVYP